MGRVLMFPFKVLWAVAESAARLGWWSARVPVRVTARTGRLVGLRALLLFVAGLAIGLCFAPTPGRELRSALRRRFGGGVPTDAEVAERVGFELAHAPRTWHLPQPGISVSQGRVELRGQVPHDAGREELERVTAAVEGVRGIDNLLVVDADERPDVS